MTFKTVSLLADQSIDEHLLPGETVAIYDATEVIEVDPLFAEPSQSTIQRTFELVSGEGDTDNSIFEFVENEIRLSLPLGMFGEMHTSSIDFEVKPSLSLRFRTNLIDNQSNEISGFEEVLQLTVNDLADPFSEQSTGKLLWYNTAANEIWGWEIRDSQHFGSQSVLKVYGLGFFGSPHLVRFLQFPVTEMSIFPEVTDSNWEIISSGDFGGDGSTAFLQRDRQTLELQVMTLENGYSDTLLSIEKSEQLDQNWQVVATDNFNNDGKADIVWQDQTTGATAIWYLEEQQQRTFYNAIPEPWTERNGGNQLDLSLAGFADGVITNGELSIETTGDFNDDNQADFVLRDTSSGNITIWLMEQAKLTSQYDIEGISDLNWSVMSSSDFNGDGKSDLAWHNNATGEVQLWHLDGQTILSKTSLNAPVAPELVPVSNYSPSEFAMPYP